MSYHVFNGRMRMSCATAALFAATLVPATVLVSSKADAQSATQLPPVTVEKAKPKTAKAKPKGKQPASAATSQPSANAERVAVSPDSAGSPLNSATSVGGTSLPASEIASRAVSTSDTASVLGNIPGVSVYTAGGVSGLPTIQGFADDRLRIKVDGMDTIASCPNHMNSPLSYIAPSQIGSAQVWTGVAPVSIGGDAIGGAILVNSREPLFAAPGQGLVTKGSAGAFYRSNGDGWGGDLSAAAATEHFSLSYDGSHAESGNYSAGGNFKKFPLTSSLTKVLPRDEVGSTAYEAQNHLATLAYKNNGQLIELKANYQNIPEELYPNQRMDMLSNEQIGLNLRYLGKFNWGSVETRAYWQHVDHFMDFGEDKLYSYGALTGNDGTGVYPVLGMPMYTETNTVGHSSKVDVNVSGIDVVRAGYDLQFIAWTTGGHRRPIATSAFA